MIISKSSRLCILRWLRCNTVKVVVKMAGISYGDEHASLDTSSHSLHLWCMLLSSLTARSSLIVDWDGHHPWHGWFSPWLAVNIVGDSFNQPLKRHHKKLGKGWRLLHVDVKGRISTGILNEGVREKACKVNMNIMTFSTFLKNIAKLHQNMTKKNMWLPAILRSSAQKKTWFLI